MSGLSLDDTTLDDMNIETQGNTKQSDFATARIVQVALPVPLERLFDYSLNEQQFSEFDDLNSLVGTRVEVPFGKKKMIGIVMDTSEGSDIEPGKLKSVEKCIDKTPIFESHLLILAHWLSAFYLHPIGEVVAVMLPALIKKGADAQLLAEEQLTISKQLVGSNDIFEKLKNSKRQAELAKALQQVAIKLSDAKKDYSNAIVQGLLDKNIASVVPNYPEHNTWKNRLSLKESQRPNSYQAIAISSIVNSRGFSPFLIEGVTGSGKTEVYLQIIEEILKQGKQVLVLVPEIGLTPQTVQRFEKRFGNVVSVWHSGMTDNERLQVWKQSKFGLNGVVIGTRSAVFLPFYSLGMLIVDEEHDESYKQQDSLRYHARDLALYRAKSLNLPVVLGSATPSLESLYNALSKKYTHLELPHRAAQASMPSQHLVDVTGLQMAAGISPPMLKRLKIHLENGNQVLIFANRRGYAPSLICQQCGHIESCDDCDMPYTLHLSSQNIQCHRCGEYEDYREKCSACGSFNVSTEGVGTEQIQQKMGQLFPEFSCVRIDSDSTRSKQRLHDLLNEINSRKHQILVGTQILSKGHHFPNVTMALILNVDSMLFSSDFRAPEKLAQLVTQISGRAGRADKPGEVWLQSYQVGHPLLQDLVNNGYSHFARTLLHDRRAADLPPCQWQVAVRAEHIDKEYVLEFLHFAVSLLAQFSMLKTLGPFPAGVEKKQKRYRFIVVSQCARVDYLNKALQQTKKTLITHKLSPKVRWAIDFMPIDFC